jgi:YD repeat-containing protein
MDSTTDALGNTRFTFDAAGNVAAVIDPEGRKVGYEWNSDGLLVKLTRSPTRISTLRTGSPRWTVRRGLMTLRAT